MHFIDTLRDQEPQIFQFWKELTKEQREDFLKTLEHINIETLAEQKNLVQFSLIPDVGVIEPFEDFAFSGHKDDRTLGQELLLKGEVGCLLLAGGQGTRLQHEGPKGTYPISIVKHKSLFQLCAEKVLAASKWANQPFQLAIMTSSDNDEETRTFFQKHHFFGLNPSQISFFVQGSLPFLDAHGKLFLKKPWQIASGADGNGNSLLRFAQSGLLKKWVEQGIKIMTILPIDNPLADPFDAEWIGYHVRQRAEMTLKCTEKKDPEEKVGVLVKQRGRCSVIEYSEISPGEKQARRKDGKLVHCCANLSLFCISLDFVSRIAHEASSLPLHKAWKAAQYVDGHGISHTSSQPMAWKFETFIFDWLQFAGKVAALIYPREECFAPLKNFSGSDSPETVRLALQKRDRAVLHHLTGLPAPETPFELTADFYYPTPELKAQWKGRSDFPQ